MHTAPLPSVFAPSAAAAPQTGAVTASSGDGDSHHALGAARRKTADDKDASDTTSGSDGVNPFSQALAAAMTTTPAPSATPPAPPVGTDAGADPTNTASAASATTGTAQVQLAALAAQAQANAVDGQGADDDSDDGPAPTGQAARAAPTSSTQPAVAPTPVTADAVAALAALDQAQAASPPPSAPPIASAPPPAPTPAPALATQAPPPATVTPASTAAAAAAPATPPVATASTEAAPPATKVAVSTVKPAAQPVSAPTVADAGQTDAASSSDTVQQVADIVVAAAGAAAVAASPSNQADTEAQTTPPPAAEVLASAAAQHLTSGQAGQAAQPRVDAKVSAKADAKAKASATAGTATTQAAGVKTAVLADDEPIRPGLAVDKKPAEASDDDASAPQTDSKPLDPSVQLLAANIQVPATTAPSDVRATPQTIANLSAQIVGQANDKTTRFNVQLDPAGLGKVDVKIEIGANGQLTAAMSFASPHAAAELRGRANELQQALQQAGFDVSKGGLSFESGGQNGQNLAQQQQQQGDTRPIWRGQAFTDLSTSSAPSTPSRRTAQTGGVDVMV